MLTIIGEYTRECLAIEVPRCLGADEKLYCLTELFANQGPPDFRRSDNGSEFTAPAVRDCLPQPGVKTIYIEPVISWEKGYNETVNGKMGD